MEPTVEELRKWSAEKVMGWDSTPYSWYDSQGLYLFPAKVWRPDDPTTGQIWQFLERVLSDRWSPRFELRRGCVGGKWSGLFPINEPGRWMVGPEDDNPCLAILKASHAAKKEKP